MPSSDKKRDFTAFEESNYPGMIVPEMFNDTGDAGDGFPGVQRAIHNYTKWWLHSGNMDSGLHIAGYDITGVEAFYVNTIQSNVQHQGDLTGSQTISGYENLSVASGVIECGILSPYESSSAPFDSGTQDGELFWDTVSESLYRWESDIEAWIEVGT